MARRWNEDELALLRDTSLTLVEVAARTGRTVAAVEHKAIKEKVDRSFRIGVGLIPGNGNVWTPGELEVLANTSLTPAEVSALTGRSRVAVRVKASSVGVRRMPGPWQEWELALVADTTLTATQVAAQIGRTPHSVRGKARSEGIVRGIRRGDVHYKWTGGFAAEQSWRGEDWPQVRLEALERDGYTCRDCGFVRFSGLGLRVHHEIPYRLRPVNDLKWLTTLCKRCHIRRPEHRWPDIPDLVVDQLELDARRLGVSDGRL